MTDPDWWEDPRHALKRHGARAKRSYSQNFLVSRSAVESIVDALEITNESIIAELGPGLGTLTRALVAKARRVVAIEMDPEMRAVLAADFENRAELEVRAADASRFDFSSVSAPPHSLVVAGNIPYAITGEILRNLVEQRGLIARAVLMVQKEVRDRLIAEAGTKSYGALSVFVQAAFKVSSVRIVRKGAFFPAPNVDSAIVKLAALEPPRAVETAAFRATVRAAFQSRRKTLTNALRTAGFSHAQVERAVEALGLDAQRRGETLTVEEFSALSSALGEPESLTEAG